MILEYLSDGWEEDPLILLHSGTTAEVRQLRELVFRLSRGTGVRVEVHCLSFVDALGACRLAALSAEDHGGVVQRGQRPEFEWILQPTSWETVGLMLQPFSEPESAGYQFLSSYADGATIIYSTSRSW